MRLFVNGKGSPMGLRHVEGRPSITSSSVTLTATDMSAIRRQRHIHDDFMLTVMTLILPYNAFLLFSCCVRIA